MKQTPSLDELFEKMDPFTCRHAGTGLVGCPFCDPLLEHVAAAYRWGMAKRAAELAALREKSVVGPVPMLLTCPNCGERHVDAGEFATKAHHTHACQSCGMCWRPAVVATVGVRFLPGFKDAPPPESVERRSP